MLPLLHLLPLLPLLTPKQVSHLLNERNMLLAFWSFVVRLDVMEDVSRLCV
jgi:hypothetical protein